ncbi:transcriptional regulator with XRE-family HTH domain [Bacillus sp. SLBN-46]|uniref:helix-turn-helix domain-containing protein n=1 Tax=Bacillus sp. SLBN-46 TaxID=3042283 RepID=UPI002865E3E0|nr:helix-turn-helix transcriptional regulator [Bacillus sp. SLBN-46]MDR6121177.1 transcriptional regulator with XRE-family HTH domain [Bacillus sp. SLBN-46]
MKSHETIGELIVRLRMGKQKTQDEIADCSGVSRKHLSNLENNKVLPNYDTIMKLARILEVRPSTFTNIVGKMLDKRYEEGDFPDIRDI